jgi:endonuclease YncB( thermonuclease family)
MLASLLLLAALASASSLSEPIHGMATAGDGDSLKIGDVSFRLFGIDAPELDQSCLRAGKSWQCGVEAHQQLQTLVSGKQVRCIPVDQDQHGRLVARCITRDTDLNRAMVERGYAVAFRKYSPDYVAAEAMAKAAGLGLWSGTFKLPEEHRATARSRPTSSKSNPTVRKRVGSSTTSQASAPTSFGGCVIKGNHSRRGDWIYHLPGMPYYQQTRAEQMFCSEAEARAAGYRRAIVR